MDKLRKQELEHKIENASPLDFVSVLQEIEQYEKEETKAVIDDLYKEFKTEGDMVEKLVVPVFTSVIDGFLEANSATRKLRKKGITASRIIAECQDFSYCQMKAVAMKPNGYVEWKNINDFKKSRKHPTQTYDRSVYEDKKKLNIYKEKKFSDNGGRINAVNEYTGERNVYQYRANPDGRRNIEKYKHDHQAEVDHIVPLEKIHKNLKSIYTLSDDDIKNIANNNANYALTSARINRGAGASGKGGKFDSTNKELVKDQEKREKEGRPNLGLSKEAKKNMITKEEDATKFIYIAAAKQTGSVLSEQAANQSKDYIVGNIILFVIKPLYFEITDVFYNGLKDGVHAETVSQAFSTRFGRIKHYVLENVLSLSFWGNNAWDFVKGFISSLIEGLISLFVSVLKQIFKLIKEGIKVFVQAGKILFGEQSKQMTPAQKGDAIIKILGGSVIAICGIGIEALINKLGIGEPWSVVLATMMSGIASVLFMFSLDKMDLFNAKAETRQARINDIFNERIKDIKNATTEMTKKTMDKLKQQRLEFNKSMVEFDKAVSCSNYALLNEIIIKQAKLLGINLLQTTNNNNTNWSL